MAALSDFMIAQPEARAYEAAEFFGVTESWLSTVKNSDAFRQFHNGRRDEHFDRISTGVGEKLTALTEVVLDEMTERVEESRATIGLELPLQQLHDVGKMALGALGFGSRGGSSVQVNVNQDNRSVVVLDTVALQRARGHLEKIRAGNDQAILQERLIEAEKAPVVEIGTRVKTPVLVEAEVNGE